MKILIKITKEVLEKTKMCEADKLSENCAISYAVRALFPLAITQRTYMWFGNKEGDYTSLPMKAREFITAFDSLFPEERVKMKPFSFEIDVPDSVINEIGIGQVYKILSESKTLEHIPT